MGCAKPSQKIYIKKKKKKKPAGAWPLASQPNLFWSKSVFSKIHPCTDPFYFFSFCFDI
jgi:hypothetical protein